MNHSPVSPAVVHLLDWQAALASQPDGLSEAAQDAAIADWAQRCWLDLAVALPHQHHAVLAHPGNLQTAARCYLYAGEAASGWLHSPLHGTPEAPHWSSDSAALADEAARLALSRGFCAADAAVLGLMGALAAIDTRSNTLPDDFTRQRRHFPLLGTPRALPFASMPRSLRQPAHPHRLYAVMGDADWVIRCLELGVKLVVASVQAAIDQGRVAEEKSGSRNRLQITTLLDAIEENRFDAAFGGARRDEEKARAKERVFSFRDEFGQWDPKSQRPELWSLYNGRIHPGEHMRVFPLSNWTELDIWLYIYLENIEIVPLYFAAERPVVERDGTLIMVDDDRLPLRPGEKPRLESVRFRTLGCYPLTGAISSTAATLPDIIREMLLTKHSERQGRLIDHDSEGSMEEKKREGYF